MKRLLWIVGVSLLVAAAVGYYVKVDVSAAPTQLTFDSVSRGDVVATVGGHGHTAALGIGSSYALSAILNLATAVSPVAIAMSFGFAAMVGVVFGYVPARRAAALMPTEALRYE